MSTEEVLQMAIETFKLEDLTNEKLREHVLNVKAKGLGVCSRCRWSSGCLACDGDKVWNWNWAMSKELGTSRTDGLKTSSAKMH